MNLDTIASFTWMFGNTFFLETSEGNGIWSDPDYGGDNVITPYKGSYKDYCKEIKQNYGRDKGEHTIRGYCGDNVVFGPEKNGAFLPGKD